MTRRRTGPLLLVVVLWTAGVVAVAILVGSWGFDVRTVRPHTTEVRATAAALGEGYALTRMRDDGSPVRWDPCTPISWTTRPDDPAWFRDLAARAFDEVGDLAGLTFTHVPPNPTEVVGPDRRLARDDAWTPVLVTMVAPDEIPWLEAGIRGLALPVTVDGQYVTAQVVFADRDDLTRDFGARDRSWGAAMLHEAAHVAGLAHVDDPDQLLHPEPVHGETAWGEGDLDGFAALSADAACLTPPGAVDLPWPPVAE